MNWKFWKSWTKEKKKIRQNNFVILGEDWDSDTVVDNLKYKEQLDKLSNEDIQILDSICKEKARLVCIKNFKLLRRSFTNDFTGFIESHRNPQHVFAINKSYLVFKSDRDTLKITGDDATIHSFSLVEYKPAHDYVFDYFMIESQWIALNREKQINTILN